MEGKRLREVSLVGSLGGVIGWLGLSGVVPAGRLRLVAVVVSGVDGSGSVEPMYAMEKGGIGW